MQHALTNQRGFFVALGTVDSMFLLRVPIALIMQIVFTVVIKSILFHNVRRIINIKVYMNKLYIVLLD